MSAGADTNKPSNRGGTDAPHLRSRAHSDRWTGVQYFTSLLTVESTKSVEVELDRRNPLPLLFSPGMCDIRR